MRAAAFATTFEIKFRKIIDFISHNKKLVINIKKAAQEYKIDPVHIVGALVGEHTYNVTVVDTLKLYYIKALSYSKENIVFQYKGIKLDQFIKREEFSRCDEHLSSSRLWECRDEVWDVGFRGKTVGGVTFENMSFQRAFFQPFYAGQTFGLGQISPLTALEVTDLVHSISGLPRLSIDNPQAIYKDVMDPEISVIYIAAIIRDAIDAYREQGFDISDNPGITATLYNLGQPRRRALVLRQASDKAGDRRFPQENYYGWLVNVRLSDLRALLNSQ